MSYRNFLFASILLLLAAGCKPADTSAATQSGDAAKTTADKAPADAAHTNEAPVPAPQAGKSADNSTKPSADVPSGDKPAGSAGKSVASSANKDKPAAKSGGSSAQKLVGTWVAEESGHQGSAAIFTFGKDGTFGIEADNSIGGKDRHMSMGGNYSIQGDVVTVKFTSAKATASGVTAEEQSKIDQGNAQTNEKLKTLQPAHIHLVWKDDNTAGLTYEVPPGAPAGTKPSELILKRKS